VTGSRQRGLRRWAARLAGRRRADPHTLIGAYAMDAVTDDDRARFEQHMAGCETCQAEVRGLREATARLAAAAEVRPRPELRDQTVLAAGLIRQLPPITPGGQAPSRGRRLARHAAFYPPARPAMARGRAGWLPRVAVAAAAGLAVIAVVLGVLMSGAESRLGQEQGRNHEIAAVLGAPDAKMMTAPVSAGGSATVVMSHRDRSLVFTAADLPPLPRAKAYQLWLMTPGGSKSVGLLPSPRNGMTGPMVVSGLAVGDEVGLTVEPAGGSPRPTSQPIMMLGLGT
jgi:anti-sigma-K factor RskA